ncbi:MAG: hypothetical protein M1831_002655 [Alyxoria varia]|nr:MAG: hypothetical protein M1831_002655 [Alyxoria varia]
MHSAFLLAAATLLTSPITSTLAKPLERRDTAIPSAPADPTQPADGDGIGPYASKKAGIGDRLDKAKFYTVAVTAGELGLVNAESNLRHYLGDSGDDKNVEPGDIMDDLPKFRDSVKALAQNEAAAAYKRIPAKGGTKAFSSSWKSFYATKDMSWNWFFAIGGFSYSVTGVVTRSSGGGGSLKYVAHIFDRYNWDAGKSVDIGPFHFEDTELGHLHLVGLAREYTVRGSTGVNKVKSFTPTTVIPPPHGGGRD